MKTKIVKYSKGQLKAREKLANYLSKKFPTGVITWTHDGSSINHDESPKIEFIIESKEIELELSKVIYEFRYNNKTRFILCEHPKLINNYYHYNIIEAHGKIGLELQRMLII